MESVRPLGGVVVLLVAIVACGGRAERSRPAASDIGTPPAAATASAALGGPTGSPSPGTAGPASRSPSHAAASRSAPTRGPKAERPPAATLVASGVAVEGKVGSYTWAGLSNSAPWLPARALPPSAVAPSSEVEVRIAAEHPVEQWVARAAAAGDADGSTIIPVGQGGGLPRFLVPAVGPTVVAVHVVFADGAGDATYYWHLDTE